MTPLVLLIVYSVLLVAIGLWVGRRVRTAGDFFVAGRRLGPGLLFATLLAANIGAGSTVGAAGLGYRDGISAWWWVGSAALGSIVLAFWVGPAMRRIAAAHDLRTVGDFLEWRWGAGVRAAITILLWVGTLAPLAGQLIAGARVLNAVAGINKDLGCLISGAVMTAYFAAGGLLTAASVNVVQLAVKLTGFALALPLALAAAGGIAALTTTAPTPTYWHFMQGGQSGWIYLAMLGPSFFLSPGLVQKVYGARDDRTVRIGVGVNALALLLFAIVPPLLGMIARSLHPALPNPEMALPMLLTYHLPPAIGALGLAAIFSAEVSAADAILFMLTTSLSQDLYKRFINPGADDRRVLRVARATAIAAGTMGVLLSIVFASIIGALSIFYTLLSVSLFVPIIGGLYVRGATRVHAFAGLAAGMAVLIVVQFATAGAGYAGLSPALIALAGSVLAFVITLAIRRPAPSAQVSS